MFNKSKSKINSLYATIIISLILNLTIVRSTLPINIKAAKEPDFGDYLRVGNDLTLYMFELDTPKTSNCYDTTSPASSCATVWPPYLIASGVTPTVGPGLTLSLLSTTVRKDGKIQLTYNGWPLYYYRGEVNPPAPFKVKCQAILESGGLWFIISPNGRVNYTTKGRTANTSKNTLEMSTHSVAGKFLTDKDGVALYVFEKDSYLKSNCYGTCALNWPPLTIASGVTPTFGSGVTGSLVYWNKRTDGSIQVTYDGWPLYYYKDEIGKPGTIKCQNKNMDGGFWWIQNTTGDIIKGDIVNGEVTKSTPVTSDANLMKIGILCFFLFISLLF
jgi:predicted lipoprotein with Yx(FWY)xxD motif